MSNSEASGILQQYVRGRTIELGRHASSLQGTELIDRAGEGGALAYVALPGIEPASVDAIVSIDGPRYIADLVAALTNWQRALRPGGTLAMVCTAGPLDGAMHDWTPQGFVSVAQLAGGLQVELLEQFGDEGFLIVAKSARENVIRGPLGLLGPAMARACLDDPALVGELHFQFGTILLQADDPASALPHFERVADNDPNGFEGAFGLGMCLARLDRWSEALAPLQRCAELDPGSESVRAWFQLAQERSRAPAQNSAEGSPAAAAPAPAGFSPQSALPPAGAPSAAPATAAPTGTGLRVGTPARR